MIYKYINTNNILPQCMCSLALICTSLFPSPVLQCSSSLFFTASHQSSAALSPLSFPKKTSEEWQNAPDSLPLPLHRFPLKEDISRMTKCSWIASPSSPRIHLKEDVSRMTKCSWFASPFKKYCEKLMDFRVWLGTEPTGAEMRLYSTESQGSESTSEGNWPSASLTCIYLAYISILIYRIYIY